MVGICALVEPAVPNPLVRSLELALSEFQKDLKSNSDKVVKALLASRSAIQFSMRVKSEKCLYSYTSDAGAHILERQRRDSEAKMFAHIIVLAAKHSSRDPEAQAVAKAVPLPLHNSRTCRHFRHKTMKYEDVACGFCGSLSIEQDLVQSSSQKFNDIVESLSKRGGSKKVLEVILEQREEESAHETSSVSNNNNPSSSSQCTDDEVELSIKSPTAKEQDKGEEVAMKTFIDTALTTPMFGIKSPQQAVTSPSNLASPKAPVSPGGSHPGFAFQEGIHKELDFDVNPSEVYLLLQRRDWNGAVQRLRTHPEEATYWISRREADGKLRWRLLPIHGAIIFCAPDTTVKSLIDAFPD